MPAAVCGGETLGICRDVRRLHSPAPGFGVSPSLSQQLELREGLLPTAGFFLVLGGLTGQQGLMGALLLQ